MVSVPPMREDGTETKSVNELVVEFKNGLRLLLPRPVHRKKNWLVNKRWMCISEECKDCMVSIGSGCSTLGEMGADREGAGALEYTRNVTHPREVVDGLGLGNVVVIPAIMATMSTCQHFVGNNKIST
jgi:hypothetical protein